MRYADYQKAELLQKVTGMDIQQIKKFKSRYVDDLSIGEHTRDAHDSDLGESESFDIEYRFENE